MEVEERFWSKVDWSFDDLDCCWEWLAAKDKQGYGRFGFAGHATGLAHRVAYELEVGATEMQLDHKCRNHGCVNPDHLEPVTNRENTMRGLAAGTETHCRDGHERTETDTYVTPDGKRRCRICRTGRMREYRARLKEAAS